MKHTMIMLLTLVSFSALASTTNIKRLKVPTAVHTAVEENYDFGRNEADFGGISSVRYFKVIKDSKYRNLKALVTYLVENEKGNIGYVCPELSVSECVTRFKGGDFADSDYMDLYMGDDDHQELIDFDKDIMTIHEFVLDKIHQPVKYTACENVWSVDVCTSIIIDPSKGKAITIDFDYGA